MNGREAGVMKEKRKIKEGPQGCPGVFEPLNVTTVISQGVPLTYFAFQGLFPICILGVLSFTPNAD